MNSNSLSYMYVQKLLKPEQPQTTVCLIYHLVVLDRGHPKETLELPISSGGGRNHDCILWGIRGSSPVNFEKLNFRTAHFIFRTALFIFRTALFIFQNCPFDFIFRTAHFGKWDAVDDPRCWKFNCCQKVCDCEFARWQFFRAVKFYQHIFLQSTWSYFFDAFNLILVKRTQLFNNNMISRTSQQK